MKLRNRNGAKKSARRRAAIERLEQQLSWGRKPYSQKQAERQDMPDYEDIGGQVSAALTEYDKKRIQNEIDTLKGRV